MTRFLLPLSVLFISLTASADVPNQALTFETNVKVLNGTSSQEAKIQSAEEIIKKIIAHEKFRDAVLNHTFNGAKTFFSNAGKTNAQIYQIMLDGAEELQPTKNNAMDIEVEIYTNNFTSTVGYTYPDTKRIYVNTKFFNSYSAGDVAHNLVHEWLHKLGFDHTSNWTSNRDYSVPYAIGSIISKLAKDSEVMNGTSSGGGTSPGGTTTLAAATNLAVKTSGSQLILSWSAAQSSAGISSYKIYRIPSGSTTATLQGTTTSLSYSQTIPTSSAQYYVKAVDKDNKTINSAKVSYTYTSVLEAVTNLKLTKTSSKVSLSWSAAQSSAGIASYKVYRVLLGSTTATLQGTTTSLTFSQTAPSKSAAYYVKVVDKKGATINSAKVSFSK